MTDTLLRHIATSRLPMSFHRREDIEQIEALRAQGLLIALVPAPADPLSMSGPAEAAQVLALTQKGRAAVAGAPYIPIDPASFPRTSSHAAKRLFSQITGGRKPLAECRRWRLYQPSIQSTMSSLACARVS